VKKHFNFFRILQAIFTLSFTTLIASCTVVYFDSPQPVDSENLKKIPSSLQGTWRNSNGNDSIIIDKTSFHFIGNTVYIVPKTALDTSSTYKIVNQRIFSNHENKSSGIPFKIVNDSIVYTEREVITYNLSDSTILRKAKNCYIFNNKNKGWWEIVVIKKEKNGIINIYYPSSESILDASPKFNLEILASTMNNRSELISDTLHFHAQFMSNSIGPILIGEDIEPFYSLKPNSTYTVSGNTK
jgi:hypothetical protein